MSDAIDTAPAEETAAFAAMQKGEEQPGSDHLPAPAEAEAAEPESKEIAPEPAAPAEPPNKVVPIQALDAERDKRKAAQEAARLNETALSDARARLKQIQEMQRKVMPNADEDPVAAMKAIQQTLQQQENDRIVLEQAHETLKLSSFHEGQFAQQNPEYNDAVKYLHEQVIGEMMDIEGLTFEQANTRAAVLASRISATAMEQGINPAIPMLRLAQRRGWRPGITANPSAAPAAQAVPAPAAVATPSAAEQLLAQSAKTLETIAAGQQAARSGAGMRGGADAPPSLREIAELSSSNDPEDIKRVEAFWAGGGVKRAMG